MIGRVVVMRAGRSKGRCFTVSNEDRCMFTVWRPTDRWERENNGQSGLIVFKDVVMFPFSHRPRPNPIWEDLCA